jgi:hypothetical protein
VLGTEQKSNNDAAAVDVPIQLKSTLVAVRRINNILLLVDKGGSLNN